MLLVVLLCGVAGVWGDFCHICDACSWRYSFMGNNALRHVDVVFWCLLCTQLQF